MIYENIEGALVDYFFMTDDLTQFIESNPDPRELKRALAVQMFLSNLKHREIQAILSVSSGFISKWTQLYELGGVPLLKLGHRGSSGYLSDAQHASVLSWIKGQQYWHLPELQAHLEDEYGVVFKSKQSYYDLLTEAGMSWKKSQKRNPKSDPELVKKKTSELSAWLESRRPQIESGKLVVLFQDECHLLWGDLCGYVWAPRDERIEVPMTNERERQTDYGAVNVATGQCLVQPYDCGNGEMTVEYITYLLRQFPTSQIVLIWDGAPYHRSAVVKDLLAEVNQGLAAEDWKITCLQFAPNDPTQNPIEDIWLQAKRWLRECYHQCQNFAAVKVLFELATHHQIFDFPKLNRLGEFSLIN